MENKERKKITNENKVWKPTKLQIDTVQKLIEGGSNKSQIAKTLGISLPTLKKNFKFPDDSIEPGKPSHVVTEASKKMVFELARLKLTQKVIADLLEISDDTLVKYYKSELKKGEATGEMSVTRKIYDLALTEGNEKMLTLIAKTKLGWKETSVSELVGKDGGAIKFSDEKESLFSSIDKILGDDQSNE